MKDRIIRPYTIVLIISLSVVGGVMNFLSVRVAVLVSLLTQPIADGLVAGLFFIWLISLALLVRKPGIVLICSILMGFVEGLVGSAVILTTIGWNLLAGISIELSMALFKWNPDGKSKMLIAAITAGVLSSISRCIVLQISYGPFPPSFVVKYMIVCVIGGAVVGGGLGYLLYLAIRKIGGKLSPSVG